MSAYTNNPERKKAHELLVRKGYVLNYTAEVGYRAGHSLLEHYSGPNGSLILQTWADGAGIHTYADWFMGVTWE